MIEEYKELIVKRNNNFYLDSKDYQVLLMLYKPLVGPRAIDFYETLFQVSNGKDKVKIEREYLIDILSDNYSNDYFINSYQEHLEKVRLLEFKNGNIELFPPVTGKEFFDSYLAGSLKGRTTQVHFNRLLEMFGIDKDTEIKMPDNKSLLNLKEYIDFNVRFDKMPYTFEDLIENQNGLIDEKVIKENKTYINSVAILYDLKLSQVISLLDELDASKEGINKDSLIRVSYEKYNNLNKNNKNRSNDDYIKFFRTNTAEMILNKNKKSLSLSDETCLSEIRKNYGISEELLALLVTYSLVTNKYKLHPYVFYEKVLNDWKENKIIDVENAYEYINSMYEDIKIKEQKLFKKKGTIPELSDNWFDEYIKKVKEES